MASSDSISPNASPDLVTTNTWQHRAKEHLNFFHNDVLANHPGAIGPGGQSFIHQAEAAYQLAQDRLRNVHDYAGYYWLIQGYSSSYNDGHLYAQPQFEEVLPVQWPGFLTTFTSAGKQVVTHVSGMSPVPMGAELISADGIAAKTLYEKNVDSFFQSLPVNSSRFQHGHHLFLDEGNPFIERPKQAIFSMDGKQKTIDLRWHTLRTDQKATLLDKIKNRFTPTSTSLTQWKKGHWWLALPNFFPETEEETKSIQQALQLFQEEIDTIKAAEQLVLDLRGNRGGSGAWPAHVAAILWGEAAVESLALADSIDYRATPENLKWFEKVRSNMSEAGVLDDQVDYFLNLITEGLREALLKEEPFFIQRNDAPISVHPTAPLDLTVYVLTDDECFSAGLDGVDIFRSLGAIHIGRETDGDTVYMERRDALSPDQRLEIGVPTKVWRNRLRASWQTWIPNFPYSGSLADTHALQAWVEGLPKNLNGV
ncbi:hypothetical protein LMG33818_001921 [Halomonadaceae bacterium LMG 33818]